MNLRAAFVKTLQKHKISNTWLATKAGVAESQVSYFKSGKRGCEFGTLQKLINALPEEAYQDFCTNLAGRKITGDGTDVVDEAIAIIQSAQLTDDQVSRALIALSSQFKSARVSVPQNNVPATAA